MRTSRLLAFFCCAALAACDDEPAPEASAGGDAAVVVTPDADPPGDAAPPADAGAVDAAPDLGPAPDGGPPPDPDCDPLVPEVCALPWPSSHYLAEDATADTGFRLRFGPTTLPANRSRKHIDPAPYHRLDGYSVGTPLMVFFPGLDASALPGEDSLAASLAEDAPILWFEDAGDRLVRIPYFAELDARETDAARRLLIVRPAVILKEATRYVVAFRGLRDTEGTEYPAGAAFAALRAGTSSDPRQARFERLLGDLERAGIARDGLQLAWDFNTASCASTHGAMLHMRDDALAVVGEAGPEITVTEVREWVQTDDGSGRPVHPHLALELAGTFRVPHYLEPWGPYLGHTGWRLHRDEQGRPAQNGWRDAPFLLRVPHGALTGRPHGLMNFTHGLNGELDQLQSGENIEIAHEHDLIIFGWNMIGMSSEDVPRILTILTDLSWYPWLSDRLHQGLLDGLMLARGMRGRLATLPEIVDRGIVVDPEQLYYSGHSQGGIYGASYIALSTDTQRGLVGVPGQNYSTLLERSVDFDPFILGIRGSYPDRPDQLVMLATVQLLWDAADPVSYYRHLNADPFPGTPPHDVIAAVAKGDWQVSPMTMEIVARSDLGVALMEHYDDERTVELVTPQPYPHRGSAVVNWHFGGSWPPAGNVPPPADEQGDPHGRPRRHPDHQRQMVHFFRTGEIIDVCEGGTCPARR